MTLLSKAITAALLLSLTPVVASAQSIGTGTSFNGVFGLENVQQGGWPSRPGLGVIVTPVQAQDCSAEYAQSFVGQNANHLNVPYGARVIGPDTLVSSDYIPTRLNLATDHYGNINRAYCG